VPFGGEPPGSVEITQISKYLNEGMSECRIFPTIKAGYVVAVRTCAYEDQFLGLFLRLFRAGY
jgi:hypothetical protein